MWIENGLSQTYLDIMAWVARLSKSKPPAPPAEGAAAAVSPAGPDILPALVDDSECQAELEKRPALTGSWMRMATIAHLLPSISKSAIVSRRGWDAGALGDLHAVVNEYIIRITAWVIIC